MNPNNNRIAVVGAGIVGMTSALRLMDAGHEVEIFTREPFDQTNSMAAGAYWWPHKAYPAERVSRWAKETFDVYRQATRTPGSGIHFETHYRFCMDPDDSAYALNLVDDYEQIDGDAFGIPCPEAYRVVLPVIDVPVYMPTLHADFLARGGSIHTREIGSPSELFQAFDLVVNATGVGARTFVDDEEVFPIRGQAVRVSRPESLRDSTRLYRLQDEFTLVLPRTHDVILGGTAQENDWSREPSESDTEMIRQRCAQMVPAIADCKLLGVAVGLRPGRKEVRLELEMIDGNRPLIHNYGHGGGGYTVAWGCANEVATLAKTYFASH